MLGETPSWNADQRQTLQKLEPVQMSLEFFDKYHEEETDDTQIDVFEKKRAQIGKT